MVATAAVATAAAATVAATVAASGGTAAATATAAVPKRSGRGRIKLYRVENYTDRRQDGH